VWRAVIIGLVLLGGAPPGCAERPATPGAVFGEWRVVAYTSGFVSAMSDAEARAWVGRTATYAPSRVSWHGTTCDEPTFTPGTWTPGAFSVHYQIRPSALGLEREVVETVEVGCPGAWTAPGSFLILDGERMFAPWDGVFFELRRSDGGA